MVTPAITTLIAVQLLVGAELRDVSVDLRGTVRGDRLGAALACGTDLDHDGDGLGYEILVGAPEHAFAPGEEYEHAGMVLWIQDAALFLEESYYLLDPDNVPTALASQLPDERFGSSVAYGDLDDDGVSDVWVGGPGYRWGEVPNVEGFGRAYLFTGPNEWAAWTEDLEPYTALRLEISLAEGPLIAALGEQVAVADVVGDGYDDLLVLAPRFPGTQLAADPSSIGIGLAAIYPNADIDLSGEPVFTDARGIGSAIVGGGAGSVGGIDRITPLLDLDEDGIGEFAVVDLSPSLADDEQAGVYLFLSDVVPLPGVFHAVQAGTKIRPQSTLDQLGAALAVGDFDGDGAADLAVGMPGWGGAGAVAIFPGPADDWPEELVATQHAAIFQGEDQGAELGWTLAVTDLDGDTIDDLVVAAPAMASEGALHSQLWMVLGGEALDLTPGTVAPMTGVVQMVLDGEVHDGAGSALCLPGDLDGDGLPEIAVGAPDATPAIGLEEAGRVFLLLSSSIPDEDGDGHSALFDCDDADDTVYPGATELCDGLDNDCDGVVPDDEPDEDGDGASTCDGDCDDTEAALNIADTDSDGVTTCDDPPDCEDDNADVAPGLADMCDGVDNDCDGSVDEDGKQSLFYDQDGDGFGDVDQFAMTCETEGYADLAGDCNDRDAAVNPEAEDLPGDGIDQDCDGADFVGGAVCSCRVPPAGRPPLPWPLLAVLGMLLLRRRTG